MDSALKVWTAHAYTHRFEAARSGFLRGLALYAAGDAENAKIAVDLACEQRNKLTQEDKDADHVTMADFDSLVAFWSR